MTVLSIVTDEYSPVLPQTSLSSAMILKTTSGSTFVVCQNQESTMQSLYLEIPSTLLVIHFSYSHFADKTV